MRRPVIAVSLALLAAGLAAPAARAEDPLARLCSRYAGLPKGFGQQLAPGTRPPGMTYVPGGSFDMGSEDFYPEEAPVRRVTVAGFWIDRHEVTNAEFARFVAATGYVTVAEKGLDPMQHPGLPAELLAPGSMVFRNPAARGEPVTPGSWWVYVAGADWRHPEGPGSSIAGKDNQPVVQVAFADARAYADWLGRDLPTEAEWEFAARGGLAGAPYVWGAAAEPEGKPAANHWQGAFPVYDAGTDGYEGRAPVGCFAPNGYGLFDMAGNVWEWSLDDWSADHFGGGADAGADATGPTAPAAVADLFARKVIKGGSWLCSDDYCGRFRPAARQPHEADLGASHVGFRTILKAPPPG